MSPWSILNNLKQLLVSNCYAWKTLGAFAGDSNTSPTKYSRKSINEELQCQSTLGWDASNSSVICILNIKWLPALTFNFRNLCHLRLVLTDLCTNKMKSASNFISLNFLSLTIMLTPMSGVEITHN